MTGLAEVLAAHREDPAYPDTCLCEAEAAPENERRGHYAAHVAAAVTAWVAERLAEADVREAVVRAMYRDVDEFGIDMREAAMTHADAAVAALLAAVRSS